MLRTSIFRTPSLKAKNPNETLPLRFAQGQGDGEFASHRVTPVSLREDALKAVTSRSDRKVGLISYTYVPNWAIARQLGWWQAGPPYGEGKWSELTPLSECHWHWAHRFNPQWQTDRVGQARGWVLILTLNGAVRKVRVEIPPEQFTLELYR